MIRRHTVCKLFLVVLTGLATLHHAAPLPTNRTDPPALPLVPSRAVNPPASAFARDFAVYVPTGRARLSPRAEVLFDN